NDISGVWQGVLLEGNRGALDVSDNHIHHLTPYVDGAAMYPAEGVYILSDKESSASAQDVTHNLFDNFNGIGIAVSAGYNLAGCDPGPCNGSVTGSISDNTFALLANAPGFLTASAIRLRATNANDALILTMGGNTGTVLAPTKTFEESPGNGTITITPSSPPNTIVTVPAPTLAVNTPASITTAEQPVAFSLASHNGSGENFSRARFQVTLTGDPGLSADQVHLQSKVGSSVFQNVALSGTTSGGGIVGFIEPAAGFDYPNGADAPNDFRLSFALGAPGGSLTSTVRLVEVSQGTGHPELNTLATDADTITVVANHAPTAADQTLSVKHDHDLAIVLASTEADGDTPLVFTHGSPDVGTLTDTDSQHLTYTPPALYVGPDSFSYTVTDSVGAETTGTVHITVTNAAPSAPNKSVTTTAGHPVAVTLNGTDADGDSLTYDNSNPSRGTLSGTAPNLTYTPNGFYVGADTFTYTTNDGIDSSTVGTVSIRVNKVVSTTTMVVTQNVPGAAPRLRIKATVSAPGAHIDTALVTIKDGTTTIGSARLVNGQINVLFTNIKKGVHTLYVYFPGSLSATASSASYHLRVFG
ncbi:MAG: hypothetical protein QOD31_3657, partial [Pseudonocardiales bacterium]|nr:hypothetical protein [Pseudonocardiales bacterium]